MTLTSGEMTFLFSAEIPFGIQIGIELILQDALRVLSSLQH